MSSIWLDLRYSLRRLRKSPGTVAIAVLTLAVGMSGPTSVYTMMDAWIFEPLPFAGSSRLLDLRAADKKDGGLVALSAPELAEWRREARTLEDLAGYSVEDIRLTGEGRPERLAGGRVTANFFALLRARPALGRLFQAGDGRPGENRVVILSHGLWRDRFLGDPAIVGKTILADDEPRTVVGVLPADFHFTLMGRVNIWTPLAFTPAEEANRGRRGFFAVARLRDGSETAGAAAEIKQIASRAAAAHPATDSGSEPRVQRLTDEIRRHHDFGVLPAIFAMAMCIFLVACSNVANIVLARAAARQREMAVRVALGASRLRVIRQWMLENGIMFAAATAIAAAVTPFVMDAITNAIPWENRGYLRNYGVFTVSGNVLLFAASICLLASLGFGLLPAVAGVRAGIQDSLREGSGKASAGKRDNRLRGFLVAAQFALALCLISGAAMLTINARNLVQKDPGFRTPGLVTFAVSPSEKQYASNARILEFLDHARNVLAAQPGVEAAAFASWAPFTSSGGYATFWIQGHAEPAPQDLPHAALNRVTAGYASVMGLEALRGRMIGPEDGPDSPKVAVIGQTLARRYFPDSDPVGAVIRVGRTGDWRRIVGVAPDVKYRELIDAPEPQVYVPLSQWPLREVFGLIRVRGGGPFDNAIRQAVLAADASEPVNRIHTMDELIQRQTAPLRILAGYTGAMGAAALFLAAIGLYGSIAYAVARRTREIGIRMALGARAEDVVKMAADGLGRLILWGVAPGLLMAILLGKALSAVLVGVSASDWRVYGAAGAALLSVALVAAAGPVRRAMRISPVEALRHE